MLPFRMQGMGVGVGGSGEHITVPEQIQSTEMEVMEILKKNNYKFSYTFICIIKHNTIRKKR